MNINIFIPCLLGTLIAKMFFTKTIPYNEHTLTILIFAIGAAIIDIIHDNRK